MKEQTSESSAKVGLSRDLSLFDITMIGVGAMIGAGIFVLTGEAAGVAGPALILSFALNGIVTIFTAMVYAELGSAIPEAGGGYLWIKEGLPGSNAFLAGWMSWFAHAVAGALYALGFGAFVYELMRMADVHLLEFGIDFILGKKMFGVCIALLFAYINFRGASETGLAGNIVTLTKLLVIGLFCLFGLKFMFFPDWLFSFGQGGGLGTSQLQPFIPDKTGWLGIASAMGLTFIAFEGYEIIVQAGEEVKEPRKNIPKAVFLSLAIVVPVYMLVAFVLVGATQSQLLIDALNSMGAEGAAELTAQMANWELLRHLGELGLAQAAAQFIPYGAVLILVGGVLSTMSALNATTFSSTRVSFAMGRDKNLPDMFAAIHPDKHTPHLALFWTALLIIFMVAFVPITTVAAAADIMFLLLFLQVNIAVITIRKKYGDKLAYGYLMPFYPIVPIIGIVTKLALALFMFDHYPIAWVYVILWLVVGFGIYRFYASGREREKEATPVLAEEKPIVEKPNAVLIPVADPETAKQHIDLGARIAGHFDSQIVLLHVITVPSQLPPRAATNLVEKARPILDKARKYAEQYDIPISTQLRVGHIPANAIIQTAQDKNTEYLIMGWKGSVHKEETVIGSNIDRVMKDSNTHAIIMQRSKVDSIQKILVPIANPKTAPLGLAVASLLSEDNPKVNIDILHVTSKTMSEEEKEEFKGEVFEFVQEKEGGQEALVADKSRFSFHFMVNADHEKAIIEQSGEYDRIIIGTTQDEFFRRKVFGKTPTRIADRARCPVVFVRPKQPGFKFGIQDFFQFFRELEEMGNPEDKKNNKNKK